MSIIDKILGLPKPKQENIHDQQDENLHQNNAEAEENDDHSSAKSGNNGNRHCLGAKSTIACDELGNSTSCETRQSGETISTFMKNERLGAQVSNSDLPLVFYPFFNCSVQPMN
jgi:ATP-dependent exoDNAse (exonuclease V) alpha subunit